MEQERRRSPRISFIASAEVLAQDTGSRMSTRVSDLSAQGCYVDTINPLAAETLVHVKILTDSQLFEAPARVVYSHTHLGMGLTFFEVPPNYQSVLRDWLAAAG